MATVDIGQLRGQAQQLAAAGDRRGAARLYADAVSREPRNGALLNSAGNFHSGLGDLEPALSYFDRAMAVSPGDAEPFLNRAVVLGRLDRATDALGALRDRERTLRQVARYWAVRASIELQLGDKNAAAESYERCLALDASHQRALHGRARIALEQGESDAVSRFEHFLGKGQGDAHAWLGYAQALDAAGQSDRARDIGLALSRQAPGWTDALQFLAELNWAKGDRTDFCAPFADAARERPADKTLVLAWCEALAGVDRPAEAALIAGDAARRMPDSDDLRLAEAVYAGAAGDDMRAEAIFATLGLATPDRGLQEARHRLRRREPERAERLLADCLTFMPQSVPAWALRSIAWRVMDDPRQQWLHGQDRLVQLRPLGLPAEPMARIVDLMHRLHDQGSAPLGQSIREGTQTRGALFDRREPEIAVLRDHIICMLEDYRNTLPKADRNHPLLRHRNTPWTITGSWSIRARGSGHHSEHIHAQGIISSAFYLVLPSNGVEDEGALELGRPPRDLRLGLPPLSIIRPIPGHCALFPSTLYHGTRPFSLGERMTIAFDIALAR